MSDSLKNKTLKGAFWTILEKIGTQGVGFAVSIVLARLLSPGDYGVIGMLAVFMNISGMFIDCGFTSALIRSKNNTDEDYSTAFWCNLGIAIFCYVALFFAAPFIAEFYHMAILKNILRVLGLNLVINALYTVQVTRLTVQINFKTQAKVAVASCILTGAVGIGLAYAGFGPWALVGQGMFASVFSGVMYWVVSGWRPLFKFSVLSFKRLFGFGSRILAASFLHTVYTNISPLIVGRKYSAADLGFYSRGDSLAALPGGIFQSTLGRVIFPVLASIQDDEKRLRNAYCKYLRLSVSIVAPAMLMLAAVSKPFISLLIGDKWLPCVPYLQLLALGWMIDPIIQVNLNMLYIKGRSDLVLKLEIVKKIIAIVIVVVAVQYGVIWLCVGRTLYSFIALVLNLSVCGPFLDLSFFRQMREVAPIYLVGGLSAGVAYGLTFVFSSNLVAFALASLAGGAIYLCLAWLFRFDLIAEGVELLRKLKRRVG